MPIAGGGLPVPEFHVELGFTANPFDALSTVAWTDITPLVKHVDGGTGRNHELNRSEPGKGSLVLNNNDGRFDPTNTASPYFPSLTPMRRARLRAVWSGVAYPIWTGYVDTFHPSWVSATSSDVAVPLSDALDLLGRTPIASTAYRDTVLADAPSRYFRLGDPRRSSNLSDLGSFSPAIPQASYAGTVNLGVAGPLVTDADTAADFGNKVGWVDVAHHPVIPHGYGLSWECWLKTTDTNGGMALEADDFSPGTPSYQLDLEFGSSGVLIVLFLGPGGLIFTTATTKPINDGNWHHVVFTRDVSQTNYRLYLDGALSGSGTAFSVDIPNDLTFGIGRDGSHEPDWPGAIDEVAIYAKELSAAQVLAHFNAGVGAWASQLTGQRVNSVLDAMGFPAADRVIDPGNTVLAPVTASLATTMGLPYLQDVVNTEDGLLFVDRAGRICFYDRHRALVAPSTTSLATFGDGPTDPLRYVAGGLDVAPDRDDLHNIVTGKRDGGDQLTARDPASVTAFGSSAYDVGSLLSANDNDVWDRINSTLTRYSQPTERVRKLVFSPWTDAGAGWPHALGRELHDRITVKHKANAGGSVFNQDSLIEGRQISWTPPDALQATFSLSVAETTPVWVLGSSALGVDTRLAY